MIRQYLSNKNENPKFFGTKQGLSKAPFGEGSQQIRLLTTLRYVNEEQRIINIIKQLGQGKAKATAPKRQRRRTLCIV